MQNAFYFYRFRIERMSWLPVGLFVLKRWNEKNLFQTIIIHIYIRFIQQTASARMYLQELHFHRHSNSLGSSFQDNYFQKYEYYNLMNISNLQLQYYLCNSCSRVLYNVWQSWYVSGWHLGDKTMELLKISDFFRVLGS